MGADSHMLWKLWRCFVIYRASRTPIWIIMAIPGVMLLGSFGTSYHLPKPHCFVAHVFRPSNRHYVPRPDIPSGVWSLAFHCVHPYLWFHQPHTKHSAHFHDQHPPLLPPKAGIQGSGETTRFSLHEHYFSPCGIGFNSGCDSPLLLDTVRIGKFCRKYCYVDFGSSPGTALAYLTLLSNQQCIIQTIASFMIIYRVAQGIAWNSGTASDILTEDAVRQGREFSIIRFTGTTVGIETSASIDESSGGQNELPMGQDKLSGMPTVDSDYLKEKVTGSNEEKNNEADNSV